MFVYVYDNKTNEKKQTIKDVVFISSLDRKFFIETKNGEFTVEKENVKIMVYGF